MSRQGFGDRNTQSRRRAQSPEGHALMGIKKKVATARKAGKEDEANALIQSAETKEGPDYLNKLKYTLTKVYLPTDPTNAVAIATEEAKSRLEERLEGIRNAGLEPKVVPSSAAQVALDAFEKLSEEEKKHQQELAKGILEQKKAQKMADAQAANRVLASAATPLTVKFVPRTIREAQVAHENVSPIDKKIPSRVEYIQTESEKHLGKPEFDLILKQLGSTWDAMYGSHQVAHPIRPPAHPRWAHGRETTFSEYSLCPGIKKGEGCKYVKGQGNSQTYETHMAKYHHP
uniref:Uncharacterized protein n=1 Tax=viral metagenome TaxID=1070528 RepID=A0A6C0DYH5_9ZZZZ